MKYLIYILKTKKYYFLNIIYIVCSLIIALGFVKSLNLYDNVKTVYKNCQAENIAYDQFYEDNDCYYNYKLSKAVTLTGEEGEGINAFVYQFIEGNNYTQKSIVNEKNIVDGEYSILNKNEVAIPKGIADSYKLKIGDKLYIDKTCCTIKYIYSNIYQIYKVDFSLSQTVIFVGIDTMNENETENICNFDPSSERMHNDIKSIVKLRMNINRNYIINIISIILTQTIISMVLFKIRNKDELKAIKFNMYAGDINILLELFLIEIGFIIAPLLLLITGILLKEIFNTILIIVATSIVLSFINMFHLYIKVRSSR